MKKKTSIVLIWKYPLDVHILVQSRQCITCVLSIPNQAPIYYTAIYASNQSDERVELWNELLITHSTLDLENKNWVVGGDLNQILFPFEHSNPDVNFTDNPMYQLQDCLLQAGLFDLRYLGPCHTWTNNQPESPTAKKLDRLLVNNITIDSYPHAVASFLAQEMSDHTPCLLNLALFLPRAGTFPYKFQNYLTKHPGFAQVINDAWIHGGSASQSLTQLCWKLKQIKSDLKRINKENYSKIQERVVETHRPSFVNPVAPSTPEWFQSLLDFSISPLRSVAYPLIHIQIQNGEHGRFWIDNWSPFGKLQDYLEGGRSRLGIPLKATLASLYRNGTWQLPAARTENQLQVLTFITTINFNSQPDQYVWKINGKSSEKFSTGEVYQYLRGDVEEVNWAKVIWSPRSIPRQSFHAWLVVQNRIPTRDRLISWGLQVPSLCLLCNQTDESRDHLYWDCGYAFDLWNRVAGRCGIVPQRSWDNSLNQMLSLSPAASTMRSLTLLGWQACIYWIWNERNNRLHANQFRSLDSLFSIIDHQIRNKIQSFRETNPRRSSQMMQRWFGLGVGNLPLSSEIIVSHHHLFSH
ncbi:hypothetical protein IGI04_028696 [Brassica rapa subsp. trilocularis]|uniref:Reverse transcriptase zinc-binding domain-containing protein n=1 Tax=Brassica rapa subsp. trilocularis TaxID=1813537 RepID=A0ABQ7L2I8_BRACM|nr:hypothetical protein IGI04_028696 [Brassica rapa subsp. trilocularis]